MTKDPGARIDAAAVDMPTPDGATRRVLDIKAAGELALAVGVPLRAIEVAALRAGITPLRYLRNQASIGVADQIRLLESKAAVIGQGGLGGHVTETLARAGVGRLVLVDGDVFETHNLNRQLFSTCDGIGRNKTEVGAERIAKVNPAVELEVRTCFLDADNAADLLAECHVVVDCLDSLPARFDVEAAAKKAAIPMVSAAVAGLTGHVTTVFPSDDGLARVFGEREKLAGSKGAEAVLGCPPQTVSLVAAMESAEVIKVLLGRPDLLRKRLWVADLASNTFEVFHLGG